MEDMHDITIPVPPFLEYGRDDSAGRSEVVNGEFPVIVFVLSVDDKEGCVFWGGRGGRDADEGAE